MEVKKISDSVQVIGKILVAVIPILVIALPIAGFSFNMGYIGVFGIDGDTLPRPVFELWQYSYAISMLWLMELIKAYTFLLKPTIYFLASISALGLTLVILRTIRVLPLSKKKYKEKLGKAERFFESFDMVFAEIKLLLYWFIVISVTLLFICLLLGDSYKRGKDFAQKSLNGYQKSGCTGITKSGWESCVNYSNPNNPKAKAYNGLLVGASSTHIAIFDNVSISVIPRSQEYVLTKAYKEGEKK